jgi:hypothetical protein
VSSDPLLVRVTDQVTALRDRAGRLQALSGEKSEAVATHSGIQNERASVISRQLSTEALNSLKTRRGMLTEAAARLEALQGPAVNGVALLARAARSAQSLADLRGRDQALLLLRAEISRIANSLGEADLGSAESASEALGRIEQALTSQQTALGELQQVRMAALRIGVDCVRSTAIWSASGEKRAMPAHSAPVSTRLSLRQKRCELRLAPCRPLSASRCLRARPAQKPSCISPE